MFHFTRQNEHQSGGAEASTVKSISDDKLTNESVEEGPVLFNILSTQLSDTQKVVLRKKYNEQGN